MHLKWMRRGILSVIQWNKVLCFDLQDMSAQMELSSVVSAIQIIPIGAETPYCQN